MTSISTKKGDYGKTSLWSGESVWKNNLRVEAYGTMDELEAWLGETKHFIKQNETKEILEKLQADFFQINLQLASKKDTRKEGFNKNFLDYLELKIESLENIIGLKGFVIRGNTLPSAKLDICCTIARRAERRIVSLSKTEKIPDMISKIINRISDLLFILARFEEFKLNKIKYLK